ncbi:hypothetical protein XELAEV_18001547mg [Xenopus laevis]|nr:hypothetical protein XELAEV_18001547mg [Xenopus laevis]
MKKWREYLKETLENLDKTSFKSFKHSLGWCTVPKGYSKIPRIRWEHADVVDLVDAIFSHYTTEHVPQVVVTVLEDIGEMQASVETKSFLSHAQVLPTKRQIDQPSATLQRSFLTSIDMSFPQCASQVPAPKPPRSDAAHLISGPPPAELPTIEELLAQAMDKVPCSPLLLKCSSNDVKKETKQTTMQQTPVISSLRVVPAFSNFPPFSRCHLEMPDMNYKDIQKLRGHLQQNYQWKHDIYNVLIQKMDLIRENLKWQKQRVQQVIQLNKTLNNKPQAMEKPVSRIISHSRSHYPYPHQPCSQKITEKDSDQTA